MNPENRQLYFTCLFIGLVVLDILTSSSGAIAYRFFTKPLIMLPLLVYFILSGKHLERSTYVFMILALVFSLLGDIFLLFEGSSKIFFSLGLGSFLMAHLFYAVIFSKKWNKSPPRYFHVITLFLTIYGILLFFYLKPELGTLSYPVLAYILAILVMAITALRRFQTVTSLSFLGVFIGALLFLFSDSILSLNMFKYNIPFSAILIMGPYATAQYLIVLGILKQNSNSENLASLP